MMMMKNSSAFLRNFTTWLNFAILAFQRNRNRIYNETAQSDIDLAEWLRKFQRQRSIIILTFFQILFYRFYFSH